MSAIAFIATVAIASVIALVAHFSSSTAGEPIDSLAVLPFFNTAADPEMEYLSDGLTDSLIYSLSQLSSLKVKSHYSVFRYKGKEMDQQVVAREMGVRAVLTGRVLQRGDNLSINAELVDARDNSVLWGRQYTRKLSDLIAVQAEITREVTDRLRLKLTGTEERLAAKTYSDNLEAYQAYLKGTYWLYKRNQVGFEQAEKYFNQAVEIDPNYALAYAGLGDLHAILALYGYVLPRDGFEKAKAAAIRALAIDNQLAEAHTALGLVMLYYDWDWAGTERELKRASDLNAKNAEARTVYSLYLSAMGRHEEAIQEAERGLELDPFSAYLTRNLAVVFRNARQYDRAIEQLKKALEMDRTVDLAHSWLARAYQQKGMYQEAIQVCQDRLKISPTTGTKIAINLQLEFLYAITGKRNNLVKMLSDSNEQEKRLYAYSLTPPVSAAWLGKKDMAFEWLESAYRARAPYLVYLKVDPGFDPLRSDPRFEDLLRRMGLR